MVFLLSFLLYFLYIVYCSSLEKIKEVQSRNYEIEHDHIFNFIIYSHNDEKTMPSLVDSIKKQEYKKEKVNISVILDNCEDNSSKILEIIGGIKIWRINSEEELKGKNESIKWLLERIFLTDRSDVYVFISPDVVIKPDFISKLNKEMNQSEAVTGMTFNKTVSSSFISQMVSFRKLFLSKIIFNGRNIAGLANGLNEDIFAIKKELFSTVEYNFDQQSDTEYELPFRLINNGINIKYSIEMRVYKQYQESFENILTAFNMTFISKIKLFLKYRKEIFQTSLNFKAKEFLLSAFYPNEFTIILMCLFSSCSSFYRTPHFIINCYILAFIYTCCVFNTDIKKVFYWISWSLFSSFALTWNFGRNYREFLNIPVKDNNKDNEQFCENSKIVDVILTNGAREINSKIELICDNSLYQAIFWFNNKKMSSQKCFKMSDALQEMIDKLMDYGFALKLCQNCGFFKLANKGRTVSDSGKCYMSVVKKETQEPDITNIWETCENIIPSHAKEFVIKELEKLNLNK
jgi:cellulose synthase/poly-beta-1,6-N-acetylglucosamine synthase-like glycosyltransferase